MASKTFAIARAVSVIGATTVLATGVTFAALTSNVATLSNNSIAETTAALSVFDPANGFVTTTTTGFTVSDLVPGTPSALKAFYLKNDGTSALDIAVKSSLPAQYSGLSDYTDLKVKFTNTNTGDTTDTDMMTLINGNVTLNGAELPVGAQGDGNGNVAGNYAVQFEIAADKVTGSTLKVTDFDLDFVGTVD